MRLPNEWKAKSTLKDMGVNNPTIDDSLKDAVVEIRYR